MSEHTPTPWACRPHEFDDWGFIRGPDGTLACVAKGAHSKDFDEHRRDGTDPYGPNAAFIIKAVNSHDALVEALSDALCELSACAEQMGCRKGGSVRRAQEAARDALALVGGSKE